MHMYLSIGSMPVVRQIDIKLVYTIYLMTPDVTILRFIMPLRFQMLSTHIHRTHRSSPSGG